MARYKGPVCRLCRREGMKLFLKGNRCFSEKCAIEKRNIVPGEHGRDMRGRPRIMGYGQQLREKQKVKRVYGVLERQFRSYFAKAAKKRGVTGELLLQFLERRLDSVVYRLGFAASRNQGRQLVRHGHIRVNGRRVDIPSFLVKAGDEVSLHQKIWNNLLVRAALDAASGRGVPAWLSLEANQLKGQVLELPTREHISLAIEESLVVELYSK